MILSSKKNKAAGPDGLPSELGHAAPQGLVRLLMPLLFKMGVTCTEPIGFKGGTLTKLYKGRGGHVTVCQLPSHYVAADSSKVPA